MEQHSQADNTASLILLEAQIRECFGRVVYSHKTQEKCSDILLSRQSFLKVTQIVLSAITTGGFVDALFGTGEIGATIGIIASTLLLTINSYTKDYDLGELAQKHKQAANDLWLVREKYLSLLTDIRIGQKPMDELIEIRDTLSTELHNVYCGAPSTIIKAYKKAQEALKNLEDMTFSDAEIDKFLPNELKKQVPSAKNKT